VHAPVTLCTGDVCTCVKRVCVCVRARVRARAPAPGSVSHSVNCPCMHTEVPRR
jgi:hypothetical protein